ncbi:MAG TPA: hypothetical protein DCP11_05300 [Microbacteriaceae bacterium]|jgi:hypothetical protein|nr:hypothetical protein [Microbacteriaceae bacterium]
MTVGIRFRVGRALDTAIIDVLNRSGLDHGLIPLVWEIVSYPEGTVIEGHPPLDSSDPDFLCELWASALSMTEYAYDTGEGERVWYLADGPWRVELSSRATWALDVA